MGEKLVVSNDHEQLCTEKPEKYTIKNMGFNKINHKKFYNIFPTLATKLIGHFSYLPK